MQIQATTPIPDPNGGAPYDRYLVTLAVSPIVDGANIRGAVSMRLTPFRTAEDGTVENLEGGDIPLVFGNVFDAAQSDPSLGQALATILGAIQGYVAARGL
jgi:hypothetical protein